jgi:hypothetical protein
MNDGAALALAQRRRGGHAERSSSAWPARAGRPPYDLIQPWPDPDEGMGYEGVGRCFGTPEWADQASR